MLLGRSVFFCNGGNIDIWLGLAKAITLGHKVLEIFKSHVKFNLQRVVLVNVHGFHKLRDNHFPGFKGTPCVNVGPGFQLGVFLFLGLCPSQTLFKFFLRVCKRSGQADYFFFGLWYLG